MAKRSTNELFHLDALQALDAGPHRLTDLDRQLSSFKPLVDEPQAYHKLFFAEVGPLRLDGRLGLASLRLSVCLNDKVPNRFKLALGKPRARPEIFDDVIGDVVGKIGRQKKAAIGSEEALVAFSFAFSDSVAPSFAVA